MNQQPWMATEHDGWRKMRLKWTTESVQNGVWGEDAQGNETDIICVRVADFDRECGRVDISNPTLRSIAQSQKTSCLLRNGDLLLEKSGGGDLQPVGAVVLYDHNEEAVCSNFVARIRVRKNFSPRFLRYLHTSLYFGRVNLRSIKQTTGIQNLDSESYFDELICVPPLAEQQAIADLLDRETERLDALLAEKERLLELLAEKRRSLITRAVTRGLNPDVSLRDSSLSWLGEIPEHWRTLRLKFAVSGIDQGWSPQCDNFPAEEGQWGVLKTGCVNGGIFNPSENKRLPDDIEPLLEIEVKTGDVLMSRASGSVDLIGSVALVQGLPSARLLLSDKTYRLRLHSRIIDAEFFVLVMGSAVMRYQIKGVISGAEGLANNIAQSDIREFLLALPSLDEQRAIVAHIEAETKKLDALRAATEHTIKLLKERRAALIAAAVTGQLTVGVET